jgi:hypothetical protein
MTYPQASPLFAACSARPVTMRLPTWKGMAWSTMSRAQAAFSTKALSPRRAPIRPATAL